MYKKCEDNNKNGNSVFLGFRVIIYFVLLLIAEQHQPQSCTENYLTIMIKRVISRYLINVLSSIETLCFTCLVFK